MRIEVRRAQPGRAVAREITPAPVVGEDENDVGPRTGGGRGEGGGRVQRGSEQQQGGKEFLHGKDADGVSLIPVRGQQSRGDDNAALPTINKGGPTGHGHGRVGRQKAQAAQRKRLNRKAGEDGKRGKTEDRATTKSTKATKPRWCPRLRRGCGATGERFAVHLIRLAPPSPHLMRRREFELSRCIISILFSS